MTPPQSISSTQAQDEPLTKDTARQLVIGDLDILKLLGTGRTGKVFLARHRATDQLLSLKIIPKASLSPKELSSALREQRILLHNLATATNDRLLFVRLLASWHDTENFYLAMVRPHPSVHRMHAESRIGIPCRRRSRYRAWALQSIRRGACQDIRG